MRLSSPDPHDPGGVRLQKVLAAAGLGSRRHCEELIAEGRVAIDGKRVREQGIRVDPDTVVITVDGERIVTRVDLVYLACHKPRGMISAMSDDPNAGDTKAGRPPPRPTLADLVEDRLERGERLFHVGRLDLDSEGLLLLTNDGELGHRLAHPSYEVPKTYLVDVPGPVGRDILRQLRRGVELDDGLAKVDEVRVLDAAGQRVLLEIVIHEGRNRVVRRMMDAVNRPVSRLVRTQLGPVQLGSLKAGRVRHLTRHEVAALYKLVDL
ncbi:MAG TPA: pseudouridine synthase [Frankiaceae bacterium]|nr:pseudouridine synthase [Frankiaceae bacterium]